MTTDDRLPPSGETQLDIGGEEDVEEWSTPNKDLASAVFLGLLSVVTMVFSSRLDVPGSVFTAPGLLPFITGATLFLMALVLGARAVRAGAAVELNRPSVAARQFLAEEENRRTLLLMAIVIAYVLLVAFINFDLRLPTPVFGFQISSFEVISVIMVTWILRLFWKAPVIRCFVVTLLTVEVLASIFRYGFGILMPETF